MASFALLIGIDVYAATSGLPPLRTAVDTARALAAWLAAEEWVAPAQIRLLCSPHDTTRGERPATRAAITEALMELQRAGAETQPGDRLFFLFAGQSVGYFDEQLLLLPHDSVAGALGARALPWAELHHWLCGTGFKMQLCFLAVGSVVEALTADALIDARLPVEPTDTHTAWADVEQRRFVSIGRAAVAPAEDPPAIFSRVLHQGLAGAAGVSVDHATAERVVRVEALSAYLEREIPRSSEYHQRCIIAGKGGENSIVAWLGPAIPAELRVEIRPVDAATQASVALASADNGPTVAERSGPPFQFSVVHDTLYSITARAPDYHAATVYGRATGAAHVIWLRRLDEGTLSARGRSLAELVIQPDEPTLPVRLYNSTGYLVPLPPRKPRGYIVRTPPDRYRASLVTPEGNVDREIEARGGESTILSLPLGRAHEPRALDRLLAALDRRQMLDLHLTAGQSALITLAQGLTDTLPPTRQGQPQISLAQVPADVVSLLRLGYVSVPGLTWLSFSSIDGEQYQLLVPLLPGRTTIIGFDRSATGLPIIELLVVQMPLLRRHAATQKRILWAQRFFRADRHAQVSALVAGLDDEPLALTLAGYAALRERNQAEVRSVALRLQKHAAVSGDGPILLAAADMGRQAATPAPPVEQLPILLAGLQHLVSHSAPAALYPLGLLVFRSAVLSQIWVVVRGAPVAFGDPQAAQQVASPRGPSTGYTRQQEATEVATDERPPDVLLVTVTHVETQMLLDEFAREFQRPFTRRFAGDITYFSLGEIGGAHTLLVQSDMGTGGPSGATLTVAASIEALRPAAIIMVGIAFGMDTQRQSIGDILVARQILAYELQRVGTGPDGEPRIIPRGAQPDSSTLLLGRFRSGAIDWTGAPVHFGLILSGDKLVDQLDFREQLRSLAPEAVGGEMEGAGLYAAAQRQKVDWILVKAVCDYADGQKDLDKAKHQATAARNAASFVLHILRQGGLAARIAIPDVAGSGHPPILNPNPIRQRAALPPLLQQTIQRYFNTSELRSLCFDLGIEYEDLSGENRSDKVRELITYAERHGRTHELIMLCRRLRPHVDWP